MRLARDRFWLWGHEAGGHNGGWGLTGNSRISPVEAACYLKIPNVIMVRIKPEPLPPDPQYLVPFRTLQRIVWSVIDAGGTHKNGAIDRVWETAHRLPNLDGVIMDDFFCKDQQGVFSVGQLEQLRASLSRAGRALDLWVVLYDNQLDLPVGRHLALCDKVTFWTWKADDLKNLETNFARFERLVPEANRRLLGCYMWDYGGKQPMPAESMRHQCDLGVRWLRERRIDGMIFLASCICDLDLETVEWTRRWIEREGETAL